MIAGILLAAGCGTRFGAHKLLHPLADGTPMALAALRNLAPCVDRCVTVVRPEDTALKALLDAEATGIIACANAHLGMGASLACGVRGTANASAWLIALADMPFIPQEAIRALVAQLHAGAAIVAPQYHGQRGHPVGFGKIHYAALAALRNDQGARQIIDAHIGGLVLIDCKDPGVVRDIDTRADLA